MGNLAEDINSGHNVGYTVLIEARLEHRCDRPEEMGPVGGVEFVERLCAGGSYDPGRAAAAIVGHADLKLGSSGA